MTSDGDVMREIWNGKIPVLFRLCPSDVYLTEKPEPLYMAVMRQSYFPLIFTEKIHKYYKRFIDPDSSETNVWLEDNNGLPVQWHWPIGVLFDLACLTHVELPWVMTVHYRDFPEKDIIRFSGRDSVESMYMSSLKEADFLKHRGQTINVMQRHEIKKLFQGITEANYEKFWSMNEKFMGSSDSNKFRHIPIRLHIKHDTIRQCLLSPYNKDNKPNTLSDLFNYFLQQNSSKTSRKMKDVSEEVNDLSATGNANLNATTTENEQSDQHEIDNQKTSDTDSNQDSLSLNSESANDATNNQNNNENSTPPTNIEDQPDDRLLKIKYLMQGISPPLDTPLLWLSRHLSYPDNFLHICVLGLPV